MKKRLSILAAAILGVVALSFVTTQILDAGEGFTSAGGDDNAATTCSGTTTYLDGEGNCDDIDPVYEGELTNSAGLLGALDDETGTGVAVFGTSPTFTTGIAVPDNSISDEEIDEGGTFAWTGGHTFSSTLTASATTDVTGAFTSLGIDDNADAEAINIDVNEIVTIPKQPAFLATADIQSNISSGTNLVFGTEVFDQNADYADSTGIFTAPVTGKYFFTASVQASAVDTASSLVQIAVISSNRTLIAAFIDPSNVLAADGQWTFDFSSLVDMDAADTIQLDWQQTGGANQVDTLAAGYFSGFLAN